MKKLLRGREPDRGSGRRTELRPTRHEALEREAVAYGAGRPLAGLAGRAAPRAAVVGGRPLPDLLRREHEAGLGADLGDLRLHAGVEAQEITDAYRADAVTVDGDVFFAAGAFRPDTDGGRRLIAHEVAHAVQQARGAARGQPLLQESRGPALRLSFPAPAVRGPVLLPSSRPPEVRGPVLWPSIPAPEVRRVDGSTFVTVYFGQGEFLLGTAGRRAVLHARRVIARAPLGTRVSVVGHASAEGPPELNRTLAERRRERVLAMIGANPDVEIGGATRVDDQDEGSAAEREQRRASHRRVDIAIVPLVDPVDLNIRPTYPGPRSRRDLATPQVDADLRGLAYLRNLDEDLSQGRPGITFAELFNTATRRFIDGVVRELGIGDEEVRNLVTGLVVSLVGSFAMSAIEEGIRAGTRDRDHTEMIMGVIRAAGALRLSSTNAFEEAVQAGTGDSNRTEMIMEMIRGVAASEESIREVTRAIIRALNDSEEPIEQVIRAITESELP